MYLTPEHALSIYASNVSLFTIAAPIATLVYPRHMALYQLPSGIDEWEVPELIGALPTSGPLDQALFNVEAEMFNTTEGAKQDAAVVYAVGGPEDYRLVAPFVRTQTIGVTWMNAEVVIGDELYKDPVMVALQKLIVRSNQ